METDYEIGQRQAEDFRVEREAREASFAAKVVAAHTMALIASNADLTPHRAEIERSLVRLTDLLRRIDGVERRAA